MSNVTVVKDELLKIVVPKHIKKHLEALNGVEVIFDFITREIIFLFSNEYEFIIDFDDDLHIDLLEKPKLDSNLINDVEDFNLEYIQEFKENLKTDVFFYGQGSCQNLFIKIYGKYLVFYNVLMDSDDDYDPDPDPDGGLPLPLHNEGDLFFAFFYKKW